MWLLSLKITEVGLHVCCKLSVATCRWSVIFRSVKQSSTFSRLNFWCSSRTHGFSSCQLCHCVTQLSPSLGKYSGVWLRWHWDVLASGIGSFKFTLLQFRYNQDWNHFLTKDLQSEPVFGSLHVIPNIQQPAAKPSPFFFFFFPWF